MTIEFRNYTTSPLCWLSRDRSRGIEMLPAWLVIAVVAVLIGVILNQLIKSDQRWFFRLRRPSWLTFEWAIPVIWITIFIAAGWSAYATWQTEPESNRSIVLMMLYALLETVTLAYTPVMCFFRRLRVGVILGGTGFFVAIVLTIFVAQVSQLATLLLVPYLLWSPIGTFVTWQMMPLNPGDA
jgi:translocator protein